jgi:hypothetical protein
MNQLSLVSLTTKTMIYDHIELIGGWCIELDSHGQCKQEMMTSLAALVKNFESLTVKATFAITCELYCPHPTAAKGTIYDVRWPDRIPLATFAVCHGPDKETFKLDGLHVKFLGVGDDLISGDSNTQVIITSEQIQDK